MTIFKKRVDSVTKALAEVDANVGDATAMRIATVGHRLRTDLQLLLAMMGGEEKKVLSNLLQVVGMKLGLKVITGSVDEAIVDIRSYIDRSVTLKLVWTTFQRLNGAGIEEQKS
jgi:hypothetical protein